MSNHTADLMTTEERADVLPEPPHEILETICDMHWSHVKSRDGITISEVHQHNACNHTISGTATIDGVEYGFVINSGDWGGTDVCEWGLAENVGLYEPPKPVVYTMVPRDYTLKTRRPRMWDVYLKWRESPWFNEICRNYNYDRHFMPGHQTETHYRAKAAERGMELVPSEVFDRMCKTTKEAAND